MQIYLVGGYDTILVAVEQVKYVQESESLVVFDHLVALLVVLMNLPPHLSQL